MEKSLIETMGDTVEAPNTQSLEVVLPSQFGARGDGYTNDTVALQNCINSGARQININKIYMVTETLVIPSNIEMCGNGTIVMNNNSEDILVIYGSDVSNDEGQNIRISGITLQGGRFGIQIYGVGKVYVPHDIKIKGVKTQNTNCGGIYVNSAFNIDIVDCNNDGGFRHVGVESPINNKYVSRDIRITNCSNINTTQFGYQTYYADRVIVQGCNSDGGLETSGDMSGITIDRSRYCSIVGNIIKNCPGSNIFITGSTNISVVGNTTYGGKFGIQCCYNLESQEDANIKENLNTVVSSNNIYNPSDTGIMLNSCRNHSIQSNIITGANNAIYVMQATRQGDSVQMISDKINISNNTSVDGIMYKNVNMTNSLFLAGNIFASYTGIDVSHDTVIEGNNFGFSNAQITNVGMIKRIGLTFEQWVRELRYADESYHIGMSERFGYGTLAYYDSNGNPAFGINVSNGDNKKDIQTYKAGAGLIVKSPNGNITKRIGIDNNGNIILTTP